MDNKQLSEVAIKTINGAQIPAQASEAVSEVKHWLAAIYSGDLIVTERVRDEDGDGQPDLPSEVSELRESGT